jgi:hypothetical protein
LQRLGVAPCSTWGWHLAQPGGTLQHLGAEPCSTFCGTLPSKVAPCSALPSQGTLQHPGVGTSWCFGERCGKEGVVPPLVGVSCGTLQHLGVEPRSTLTSQVARCSTLPSKVAPCSTLPSKAAPCSTLSRGAVGEERGGPTAPRGFWVAPRSTRWHLAAAWPARWHLAAPCPAR